MISGNNNNNNNIHFKQEEKKMRNSTGLVTFIIVGVIILFMAISTRNSIVASAEDVDNAAASVDAQLQRRNDLIPNLVATAQGYAKHEEVVFTQIAEARAQLAGAIESGNIDEISIVQQKRQIPSYLLLL